MAIRNGATIATVTELGVRVVSVENDITEIKDSLLGLDSKVERVATDLAREVRTSIATLSTQIAERQRTPWIVVIAGATLLVSTMGFIGSQALAPSQAAIQRLQADVVPRIEQDFREHQVEKRFESLEADIRLAKSQYLPRVEHDNLAATFVQRFSVVDAEILRTEQRRYDEQRQVIEDMLLRLRAIEKSSGG